MAEEIKKKEELDPQEKSFRRRKDMIKNFIIVFLVVMLVLTFFSNTIMNYSLPQVAVQYIQPGTITSVIRGEGTVESGDPYSVMVKQAKTVSRIHVKVGSIVKEGDTLVSLDGEDSEELKKAKEDLKTAEDALEAAKDEYNTALLKDVALASIAAAQGDLNVDELRKKITNAQNALKAAEDNLKACEAALADLENQKKTYQATQNNDNGLTELKKAKDEANAALTKAEDAQTSANEALTEAKTTRDSALEAYNVAKEAENTAKTAKDDAQAKLDDLNASQTIIDTITTGGALNLAALAPGSDEELKLALLRRENDAFNTAIDDGNGTAEAVRLAYELWIHDATELVTTTTSTYNTAVSTTATALAAYNNANTAYNNANTALTNAKKAYDDAKAAYTKAENDYNVAVDNSSSTATPYDYNITVAEINRDNAKKEVDDKNAALTEILGDVTQIEELNQSLKKISKCEEDVKEKKEEVAKIETESSAEEVKAPINGTILSINVTSGKKTSPDEAVVTIQPEGQGFTMSFSVDNDKAKTISVGDEASVANSWWYSDVTGVVATIRPDPNDANRKKLVTLNLQGSLTAGQTLTMSINSKTSNYDMIVPSSALKNDNKGDFVLVVQSKSSPLGNRYYAVRYDVEILATDDVQTAIKGAFEGYEPVVTTATKDITEGQQIRLSDN